MGTVETGYAHIVLDEKQVPIIAGETTKVIVDQFPYLTMGQVYSALAYYWDHKAELDADMARCLAYVDELRRNTPEPAFVARLRAQGLLRQRSMN